VVDRLLHGHVRQCLLDPVPKAPPPKVPTRAAAEVVMVGALIGAPAGAPSAAAKARLKADVAKEVAAANGGSAPALAPPPPYLWIATMNDLDGALEAWAPAEGEVASHRSPPILSRRIDTPGTPGHPTAIGDGSGHQAAAAWAQHELSKTNGSHWSMAIGGPPRPSFAERLQRQHEHEMSFFRARLLTAPGPPPDPFVGLHGAAAAAEEEQRRLRGRVGGNALLSALRKAYLAHVGST